MFFANARRRQGADATRGIVAALVLAALASCGSPPPSDTAERPESTALSSDARMERLRSLPYASSVPIAETDAAEGVLHYDPERAFPGLNVYNPRDDATTYLLDMSGKVVHRWSSPRGRANWHHVEVLADGGLLVVAKDRYVARLDRDSQEIWSLDGRYHHDVTPTGDGTVLAPLRAEVAIERQGTPLRILDDSVAVIDEEGALVTTIPLLEAAADHIPAAHWAAVARWSRNREHGAAGNDESPDPIPTGSLGDLFHLNSIEVIRRPIEGVCKVGDLLLSLRQFNTVAVLDRELGAVVWSWGPGDLEAQHHATQLANGNFLIFDNGRQRKFSRVVELDPRRTAIVWEYRADPADDFFSFSRGSAQRLPNGNTLIAESDHGRAFEVTPEGEVVWDFFSSIGRQRGDAPPARSAVYRFMRLTDERFLRPDGPFPRP